MADDTALMFGLTWILSWSVEKLILTSRCAAGWDGTDPELKPATCRMAEKLSTAEGRECYRDRKHLVESVNGWIKQVMGFRQFSIRGLQSASGE